MTWLPRYCRMNRAQTGSQGNEETPHFYGLDTALEKLTGRIRSLSDLTGVPLTLACQFTDNAGRGAIRLPGVAFYNRS